MNLLGTIHKAIFLEKEEVGFETFNKEDAMKKLTRLLTILMVAGAFVSCASTSTVTKSHDNKDSLMKQHETFRENLGVGSR